MPDDLQTRKSLLARLKTQSHDRDWAVLYKQYGAVILTFCRKQGLDEFGARDVLQETMVLLMRKLPDFDYDPARGRFRNWLLALVAGKARDALRRARRARTVALDEDSAGGCAASNGLGANGLVERAWMEGIVEEGLRRIQQDPKTKPETFAVFRAYVIEGKPVAEVATQFHLQENAIYQIRSRLLKRLRQEVAALEIPHLPGTDRGK